MQKLDTIVLMAFKEWRLLLRDIFVITCPVQLTRFYFLLSLFSRQFICIIFMLKRCEWSVGLNRSLGAQLGSIYICP